MICTKTHVSTFFCESTFQNIWIEDKFFQSRHSIQSYNTTGVSHSRYFMREQQEEREREKREREGVERERGER